jgi:hypothetical protein
MPGLNEEAKSGERFAAVVNKPRGLLTAEERKVIALEKARADASFALENAKKALAGLAERVKTCEANLAQAQAAYNAATEEQK